jgi:hypothetical protein
MLMFFFWCTIRKFIKLFHLVDVFILGKSIGVESVELGGPDRNLLEVIGDGVDAHYLVTLLQKKFGNAKLISMGPVKEPKKDTMEDEPVLIKEEENEPMLQRPVSSSIPHCLDPISEVECYY